MTNTDSRPTRASAGGPRAQLLYDAVVAAYINDISDGRRRRPPVARRRRGERRRLRGHLLTDEAGTAVAA